MICVISRGLTDLKRRRLGLLRYLDIPRNSSKSKRRVTANHLDVVALDVSTYFRTQVVRRSICKHTIDEITILLFVGKSMMMSIQASVKATTYETAPTQGQAIKPKETQSRRLVRRQQPLTVHQIGRISIDTTYGEGRQTKQMRMCCECQ